LHRLSLLRVRALVHAANVNEEGRPRGGLIEGRDSADCLPTPLSSM
jgi:hypothetical protein